MFKLTRMRMNFEFKSYKFQAIEPIDCQPILNSTPLGIHNNDSSDDKTQGLKELEISKVSVDGKENHTEDPIKLEIV